MSRTYRKYRWELSRCSKCGGTAKGYRINTVKNNFECKCHGSEPSHWCESLEPCYCSDCYLKRSLPMQLAIKPIGYASLPFSTYSNDEKVWEYNHRRNRSEIAYKRGIKKGTRRRVKMILQTRKFKKPGFTFPQTKNNTWW